MSSVQRPSLEPSGEAVEEQSLAPVSSVQSLSQELSLDTAHDLTHLALETSMPRRLMAPNKLWLQSVRVQLDNLEAGHMPGITIGAPPQEPVFIPNLPTGSSSSWISIIIIALPVCWPWNLESPNKPYTLAQATMLIINRAKSHSDIAMRFLPCL